MRVTGGASNTTESKVSEWNVSIIKVNRWRVKQCFSYRVSVSF